MSKNKKNKKKFTCDSCLNSVKEVCGDGVCRDCHKSLTFEECNEGTWSAKILLSLGRTKEHVLEIYPDAKI